MVLVVSLTNKQKYYWPMKLMVVMELTQDLVVVVVKQNSIQHTTEYHAHLHKVPCTFASERHFMLSNF
jgi:hypothetical protein